MNDFERGFTQELQKIGEYAGYSDEEIKRLRHIMRRDQTTGRKARKGMTLGGPVGLAAGTLTGAAIGATRKGFDATLRGRGKGALIGAGIGALGGAAIGPLAGTLAMSGKHAPEIWRLSAEARKIHKDKTPEQKSLMMKALWKGVPKR
jgi:hypothetical protein